MTMNTIYFIKNNLECKTWSIRDDSISQSDSDNSDECIGHRFPCLFHFFFIPLCEKELICDIYRGAYDDKGKRHFEKQSLYKPEYIDQFPWSPIPIREGIIRTNTNTEPFSKNMIHIYERKNKKNIEFLHMLYYKGKRKLPTRFTTPYARPATTTPTIE